MRNKMFIEIKEAIAHFYNNSSFDLIYSEALANSLDANASSFSIAIEIDSFDAVKTLKIQIEDNGNGFDDHNFDKFCNLLKKEDVHHKGLGRLVYLNYFQNVNIESVFANNKKRCFDFNDKFEKENELITLTENVANYAKLTFINFRNERLKSYDNLIPETIKHNLIKQFLPRLYVLKQQQKDFNLKISLST